MSATPTPLANQLLIALPALADTEFSRSVALICQHDPDGAMGIVVNRPSEYTLGEVLGQMGVEGGDETLRRQVVLAGGPVHPERGFVLHDGGMQWDSSLAIGDGLTLTTSREILGPARTGTHRQQLADRARRCRTAVRAAAGRALAGRRGPHRRRFRLSGRLRRACLRCHRQ